MRILVFGKNGQLAQCLRDASLSDASHELIFVGNNEVTLSQEFFLEYIAQIQPDAVINCMAYTNVDGAEDAQDDANQVNHILPKYMAIATNHLSLPFLHVSTDYVFDGTKQMPYVVGDKKNPLSVYGKTKSDGEDAILNASERTWILRTSWVYSIYGKNFFKTIFSLLQNKEQLSIVADQIGAPTSAHQLARHILSIIIGNYEVPYGVHHAVAGGETSWYGFACKIQKLLRENGFQSLTNISAINASEYPTKAIRPLNSRMESHYIEMDLWSDELVSVFGQYITKN